MPFKEVKEEKGGTKRPPGGNPLMTKEQLAYFAQGYTYEREVRGLTGKRVEPTPQPQRPKRAAEVEVNPSPNLPVEPPPAHLLTSEVQHQSKGNYYTR